MLSNNYFNEGFYEAYGFYKIPSNNDIMHSYKKKDDSDIRLNHYFTTGTVTLQGEGMNEKYYGIKTLEQLEEILCKIN